MDKFIPYEKLSKKEKRRLDSARRGTWGQINPVTRKPQNSKAYHRKRTQDWKKELPDPVSFFTEFGRSFLPLQCPHTHRWQAAFFRSPSRFRTA